MQIHYHLLPILHLGLHSRQRRSHHIPSMASLDSQFCAGDSRRQSASHNKTIRSSRRDGWSQDGRWLAPVDVMQRAMILVEKLHPAVGRKITQQMVEITLSNLYAWQAARNRMHIFNWREMKFGSQLHSMLGKHGLKKIIPETNRNATNSESPQLVPTTFFTYLSWWKVHFRCWTSHVHRWIPELGSTKAGQPVVTNLFSNDFLRNGCEPWLSNHLGMNQNMVDPGSHRFEYILNIEQSIYLLRYPILIHTHVAFGILKIPFRFLDSKPFLGFQERTFNCINCLFLDPPSGWFESQSPCQTLDNFTCNPQQPGDIVFFYLSCGWETHFVAPTSSSISQIILLLEYIILYPLYIPIDFFWQNTSDPHFLVREISMGIIIYH